MGKKQRDPRCQRILGVVLPLLLIFICVLLIFRQLNVVGTKSQSQQIRHRSTLKDEQVIAKSTLTAQVSRPVNSELDAVHEEVVVEVPPAKTSESVRSQAEQLGLDTVLLIVCSKRPQYLKRSLDAVLKYHPK